MAALAAILFALAAAAAGGGPARAPHAVGARPRPPHEPASAALPVGTAIEQAEHAESVLAAACRIAPPRAPFAPAHLAQDTHQLKRQQHASNALARLARLCNGSGAAPARAAALRDERFARLVECAAAPSVARADGADRGLDELSARAVAGALGALGTLCAADAADRAAAAATTPLASSAALEQLRAPALALAARADALADAMRAPEATAARWAARRLLGREARTPRLDALCAVLPFDFWPSLVALPVGRAAAEGATAAAAGEASALLPSMHALVASGTLSVEALRAEIPFEQATLLTADGARVRERRHTAWLAAAGIGALAYSGKLMPPSPLGDCRIAAAAAAALRADTAQAFDCALCNLYPAGGEAACAFHRDPEHGTKWALETFVLAVGEPRRFAFRPHAPLAPLGVWAEGPAADGGQHVVTLVTGDVVTMRDECNVEWEHAVLPGQGRANEGARVSLVFKRALATADGRKGHTLQGEGRRARARRRDAEGRDDAADAAPAAAARPPNPQARTARTAISAPAPRPSPRRRS